MPPSKPALSSILDTLQKEYVVLGKRRVTSFHAWSAIALVLVGATFGISLVANRSGEFEKTKAAGATIVAVSCNQADVQNAINAAVDGDTVVIPAGTCTWTLGINILRAITITGSGAMPSVGAATSGGTRIPFNAASGTGALFGLTESTVGHVTLQNITVVVNESFGRPIYAPVVVNERTANGQQVIIHHMTFEFHTIQGSNSIVDATAHSVIYRNKFSDDAPPMGSLNQSSALRCHRNAGTVDAAWESASTMGTNDTNGFNNAYFEDNDVTYMFQAIDFSDGCRLVVRHNNFTSSISSGHGFDSGTGSRHEEIYDNAFHCGSAVTAQSFYIFSRGGTGVITDNTFDQLSPVTCAWTGGGGTPIAMSIYKLLQQISGGWAPPYPDTYPLPRQIGWGWITGATKTIWAGVACDPLKAGFIASHQCQGANQDGLVRSGTTATFYAYPGHRMNTGDTVTVGGFTNPNYNGTFTVTVLDPNRFTYTVANSGESPALQNPTGWFKQSARGGYRQDLEPWYIWNNTNNNSTLLGFQLMDDLGLGLLISDYFQQNREYYLGVAKPSYTKYQYPHPLATVIDSGSTTPPPTSPVCGNGVVETGEQCDTGSGNGSCPSLCSTFCTVNACPTTDTTSPSVPTGLSASVVSSSQINLSWTSSTDNVGVAGYKVYRNGTQVGTASVANFSNTGLSASTSYTYTVAAYDAAGNTSAQSASVSATTQGVTPTVNKFIIGDRVQTTSKLNVRLNPGGGKPLGQQQKGAQGTVTLGPQTTNNTWYKIDYDTGVDGWSVQDYLVKI